MTDRPLTEGRRCVTAATGAELRCLGRHGRPAPAPDTKMAAAGTERRAVPRYTDWPRSLHRQPPRRAPCTGRAPLCRVEAADRGETTESAAGAAGPRGRWRRAERYRADAKYLPATRRSVTVRGHFCHSNRRLVTLRPRRLMAVAVLAAFGRGRMAPLFSAEPRRRPSGAADVTGTLPCQRK